MTMSTVDPTPQIAAPYIAAPVTAPPGGWYSFDQLREALPDWTTPIEEIAPGEWIRRVPVHTGEIVQKDGVDYARVVKQVRHVALTKQGARDACMTQERGYQPTDYWDGWTWWRDGIKPERDMQVEMAKQQVIKAEYELQPLSPVEEVVQDAKRAGRRAAVAESTGRVDKE